MNILDFNTLVSNQVAAQQAKSATILDFSPGSVLLAIAESNANVAIWLQAMIIDLLAATRASTSTGTTLDSWVNDFGVVRLSATGATGSVTFSRFSPSLQALIYPGTTVQTADGSQTYQVAEDAANAAWDATVGAYVIPIGTASITVPVQSLNTGISSNVPAGTITVITTFIPNVDTVTNAIGTSGGQDIETDAALRVRFVEFIASLPRGTRDAVAYAILSVQPGLAYAITENYTYAGAQQLGYFYVVVDDGSGRPSQLLLDRITAAIDKTRPMGSTFGVYPPEIMAANVTMALTVSSGTLATIAAAVEAALTKYLNSLQLGARCPYSKLADIAYNTSPLISNVTGISLNGGTTDLVVTSKQIIKAGTVSVN